MNQKERMLAELPYKAWMDGLGEERNRAKKLVYRYNRTASWDRKKLKKILHSLLGKMGGEINVEPPFRCDYGTHIDVGNNFYANFNCTILDVAKVRIGENVMFGPNVSLYTAGHPVHPEARNSGLEYGIGITIGDNVWIGGSSVVNPGVKIGDNVVIGSGSVVTKDIPPNVVAAGNPCRVIREIRPEDSQYYFKKRRIDETLFGLRDAQINLLEVKIDTPRLVLQCISLEDVTEIYSHFTGSVTEFMFPKPPENPQETRQFVTSSLGTMQEGTNLQLVIREKQSGNFLGCLGLHNLGDADPELGIWIREDFHGKKFGLEAVTSLIGWARKNVIFDHLKYPVDRRNIPSCKIPEANGGKIMGEYKEVSQSGKPLDEVEYWIFP